MLCCCWLCPLTPFALSVGAARSQGSMSLDGFQLYLCSQEGSIFNTEHKDLYQDMSQPLNHYFISSSHNTSLLEDQLRGQSSLEAYIQ